MRIQYKKICTAIATGNLTEVRAELRTNPAVAGHWKPLCDAAFYGNSACIELLVDAGADPNQVAGTASRHTPLTRIAQYHKTIPKHEGHSRSLSLLLDRGAKPNISAGPMNLTPLAYATVGPLLPLVDVLRPHRDPSDIFSAAALYDKSSLDHFVSKNPSSSREDHSGRSPLHYVGLSGMWREEGAAASLECARLLLSNGYEVDSVEVIPDEGEMFEATPLWYAVAHSQNLELIRLLLKKGASPNPATFAATYLGDLEIVELLHQHKADWNLEFAGRTPIQDLLIFRRTKLVPWLLDHGASVAHRDPAGKTALHIAAERGCKPELLQNILDHGGELRAMDNDGRTPLDLAREKRKSQAVKFLQNL
ncbi:MAG: ankyrin repeat domain-containing protein [Gammaproteobacteria bacterium]|nr:ankyrin repeat domain-containing protein [Gammaproteobacteria bacterium]